MNLGDKLLNRLVGLAFIGLCQSFILSGIAAETAPARRLAELDISNPALRTAYERAFLYTHDDVNRTTVPSYVQAVVDDLRQRGGAVTPLLIAMIDHPSAPGDLAARVLDGVSDVGEGDLSKICDHLRTMWAAHLSSLDIRLAYSMAWFLAKHGEQRDLAIIEEIDSTILKRSGMLDTAKKWSINRFDQRRAAIPTANPMVQSSPKHGANAIPAASGEAFSSTPWSIIAVLIVVALGMLWLLLNRRS